MADANSITNACFASSSLIPQADLFYSPLAEAFRHLDCRHLTTEEIWRYRLAVKRCWQGCTRL